MFLWWCPKVIPDSSGRFSIFSISKKALFFGILWIKTTIVQMIENLRKLPLLNGILNGILNSILRFSPLRFNYRFHDFWHAINELWSVLNRPCVPNMLERILPRVHCSLMVAFFTPLYIFLCFLKSLCKFSFMCKFSFTRKWPGAFDHA